MNKKALPLILVLIFALVAIMPASAQDLGDDDKSQITVQNISGGSVDVQISFVSEAGSTTTPTCLDLSNPCTFPNPFTLADQASRQVIVRNVPGLASGRFAVVVSSSGQVVAMAGVASDGPAHFNGTYAGFSNGGNPVYIPSVNYNHYGNYGMVSVMNLGTGNTNITLEITCSDGVTVGTVTANNVPMMSSHTFVLKDLVPSGFTAGTICQGSGKLTASPDMDIAAVNAQNRPAYGNTLVFEGSPTGYPTLYLPQLQVGNFGWNTVVNVRKLEAGDTTVTLDYSDAEPNDTCPLTNATPSCQFVLKDIHPTTGRFSAVVTNSANLDLQIQVGNTMAGHATQAAFANGYIGFSAGTNIVAVPAVQKRYYGWVSAVNCQNISAASTQLQFTFQGGYAPYNPGETFDQYDSYQLHVTANPTINALLPDGYYGGVTVTALNSSADIVCTVGNGNPTYNTLVAYGDWNNMYDAPNR